MPQSSNRASTSSFHGASPSLFSPLVALCLALLVLLSQCSVLSAQAQPTSASQVVITAVTGCTDIPPITVNCTVGANVTIHTTGLGSLLATQEALSYSYLRLSLGNVNQYVFMYLDTSDPTNSTLWALVAPPAYNPAWMNAVVNVSLYVYAGTGSSTSPQVAALTFAYEPPPTISSISGCTGSGQSTINCAPDTAVLTILGTGIGWLSATAVQLRIGTNTMYSTLRAVNSTYGTLSLASIYYGLLLPEHYNGVLLPVQFTTAYTLPNGSSGTIASNALSISFIPLPAPYISRATAFACDSVSSGVANYTGCIPGGSLIYLFGHYLYGLSGLIGNAPCATTYSDADTFYCYAPVGAGLQPNVAYTASFSNSQGSLTLPSFISFTSRPSIAYIATCAATYQYSAVPSVYGLSAAYCNPGAAITIKGSQFSVGDQVQVNILVPRLVALNLTAFNITCLTPTVVDSSTVTCVLPAISDAAIASYIYGRTVNVQLAFKSGTVFSNSFISLLYSDPAAPVITGLTATGCGPVFTNTAYPGSPLQVSGCVSNATLTLTGFNFNASRSIYAAGVAYNPVTLRWVSAAAAVLSNTSTQVVLQLPDINNITLTPILTDTQYQLMMQFSSPYYQSNIILLTFASSPAPSTTSSSTLSTGAIAGVVVAGVVVAVVFVGLVLLLLRRRSLGGGKAAGSDENDFSGSLRPTRLHEDSSHGSAMMTGVELQ